MIVTLQEAKSQLRVDGPDEDTLIEGYIAAATEYTEALTSLLLSSREIAWTFDSFAGLSRPLPRGPIQSVAITYEDEAGATRTVDPAVYRLREQNSRYSIELAPRQAWPDAPGGVTVTAQGGYADPAEAPQPLRQAILMLVAHFYAHRPAVASGAAAEVPLGFAHLVAPYRLWVI